MILEDGIGCKLENRREAKGVCCEKCIPLICKTEVYLVYIYRTTHNKLYHMVCDNLEIINDIFKASSRSMVLIGSSQWRLFPKIIPRNQ